MDSKLTDTDRFILCGFEIKRIISTCDVYRSVKNQDEIAVWISELLLLRFSTSCEVDKLIDWALFMVYPD